MINTQKRMFILSLLSFCGSAGYGLTCKDTLTDLNFFSATIKTNAVACRYRGYHNDGTGAWNMYYMYGEYQTAFGDWKLDNRKQYACLASPDGNSSECQFILKNLKLN